MNPQLFQYTGIWPEDAFAPAAKLTSALKAQLEVPIKFEYTNGMVGKVFAPAGVSATVLNLHRGILNILQLNLKNTQNVYELHEVMNTWVIFITSAIKILFWPDILAKAISFLKAGPQGVCKTHYMISEDEKTHQIAVRKSKDLTNCHERVIKDIGLAYTETCVECQKVISQAVSEFCLCKWII